MMLSMIRIFFVVALLSAGALVAVLTLRAPTQGTTENRALAGYPAPPVSLQSLQKYFQDVDAWAVDRMHFRQQFITWLTLARLHLGVTTFRGVFVGKNDWLFFNNGGEDEDARGSTRFTPEELHRWKSYLLYRKSVVEKAGGKFIFLMLPNKSTIYPEYLPDNFTRLSDTTRMQQLVDEMRDTGVTVLDARAVLLAGKQSGQLYLKNDTHWNLLGANYAQYLVMQEIEKDFPAIRATLFPFHDASPEERDRIAMSNDLYRSLALGNTTPVYREPQIPIVEGIGKCVGKNDPHNLRKNWPLAVGDCSREGTPETAPSWFALLDRVWGHLPPDLRSFLFKSTVYESGHHTVLVAHDSYFEMMQPYFCNQFKHAYYVALGGVYEMWVWQALLDAVHPDVVVEEVLERGLKTIIPKPGVDYPQT